MQKAKLARYRTLLHGRLNALMVQSGEAVHEMTGEEASEFPDPNDRASAETDRTFELRLRDRDRKLVSKIKEALRRIDDGTFGLCEECGEPIGEKRLAARPVTTLCIDCKEESEQSEKRRP